MIKSSFGKKLNSTELMPYLFLILAFLTLIIPLILKTDIDIYDSRDEVGHHYPTILTFTEQFPYLDLSNYRSATTPFYHIILMSSGFIVGTDLTSLRLVSAVISLICLLIVYRYLSKRGDMLNALLFSLILMLSPYFIGPAIRLSTDNAALLFVLLSIMMIDRSVMSPPRYLWANIFILLTVLTRQVHIWLVVAYLLINLRDRKNKLLGLKLKYIWPVFIPIISLLPFIFLWKGLTPPNYSGYRTGTLNWDAPVYLISLLGLYGAFFSLGYFRLYQSNRGNRVPILGLIALAAVYLLLHPVSNEYYGHADRGGALWLVIAYFPTLFSSSIIYWILFPVGLFWLYLTVQEFLLKQDYLMVICFFLWLVANIFNPMTYQKYYEPFLFFFMGYLLVSLKGTRWYDWLGPLILLTGFVAINLFRFFL